MLASHSLWPQHVVRCFLCSPPDDVADGQVHAVAVHDLQVKYVLNKDKAQLPKPETRGKSFDGIQLAVDGAERCDIPKYFACCAACYQAAQQAELQGEQPKLPKQVSTIDLEPQDCKPLGKTIEDKASIFSLHYCYCTFGRGILYNVS